MAEELIIKKGTREEQYLELIPQIAALMEGETGPDRQSGQYYVQH